MNPLVIARVASEVKQTIAVTQVDLVQWTPLGEAVPPETMSLLFWNYGGLSRIVNEVFALSKANIPSLVFLCEMRQSLVKMDKIDVEARFESSFWCL